MMRSTLLTIFVFLSFQFLAQCQIMILPDVLYYNLTTTSRTDLFLAQNKRQFSAIIKTYEEKLHEFEDLYEKRIETFTFQQELLETKLYELENKLNPLEVLDDISDYCVQKYRKNLPVLLTIKTNFAKCFQTVNNQYPSLVSTPTSIMNNLKNYHDDTFENSLQDCKEKFESMEGNYTSCILTAIKTTTEVTNENFHNFRNEMKIASCSAKLNIKEAFDCYSEVLTTGLTSIAEVWTSVEKCIGGHEFCPRCNTTENMKGRCPYQMSWHLAEGDLGSEKITNPFKGISMSTPCLQINFINKSVQLV